jgi:hypothetical protein
MAEVAEHSKSYVSYPAIRRAIDRPHGFHLRILSISKICRIELKYVSAAGALAIEENLIPIPYQS